MMICVNKNDKNKKFTQSLIALPCKAKSFVNKLKDGVHRVC